MWPKFLKSKWFERLFTATLSVMLLLLTQRLTIMRENDNKDYEEKKEVRIELTTKASVPYVDGKCKELDIKIEHSREEAKAYTDKIYDRTSNDIHEIRNFLLNNKGKFGIDKRNIKLDTTRVDNIEIDASNQLRRAIAMLRLNNKNLEFNEIIIK